MINDNPDLYFSNVKTPGLILYIHPARRWQVQPAAPGFFESRSAASADAASAGLRRRACCTVGPKNHAEGQGRPARGKNGGKGRARNPPWALNTSTHTAGGVPPRHQPTGHSLTRHHSRRNRAGWQWATLHNSNRDTDMGAA